MAGSKKSPSLVAGALSGRVQSRMDNKTPGEADRGMPR